MYQQVLSQSQMVPGAPQYNAHVGQPQMQQVYTISSPAPVQLGFQANKQRSVRILASFQIAIAVLCIVLQSINTSLANVAYDYRFNGITAYLAPGIWTSFFFLSSGIVGICSAQKKSNRLIVAFMVLNILGSVSAFVLLATSCTALSVDVNQDDMYIIENDAYAGFITMDVLILVLAIAELIITICCAAVCCSVICCISRTSPVQTTQPAQQTAPVQYAYAVPPGFVVQPAYPTVMGAGSWVVQTPPQAPPQATALTYGMPSNNPPSNKPPAYETLN